MRIDIANAVDWTHPLNRGRVFWWLPRFDGKSGGNGLDFCNKVLGSGVATPGKQRQGSGVTYNGSTQYTDFGLAPRTQIASPGFSVVVDFTPLALAAGKSLFGRWASAGNQRQWLLLTGADSSICELLATPTGVGSTYTLDSPTGTLANGRPVRIAITVAFGVIGSMYADGKLVSATATAIPSASFVSTESLKVQGSNGSYVAATYRECAIWSRPLTAAEVAADFAFSRDYAARATPLMRL